MKNLEGVDKNTQLQTRFPYLWKWSQGLQKKDASVRSRVFREETRTNSALLSCLGKDGIQSLLEDAQLHHDLQCSLDDLTERLSKEGKRPTPRIKQLKLWDAALELHALRTGDLAEFASAISELGGHITRLSDLFQPAEPEIRILRELAMGCCNIAGQPNLDARAPLRALKELANLDLDNIDVFIARNIIFSTDELGSEDTTQMLGVTRQTVWNRKKSLITKFESLQSNEDFKKLVNFAESFTRHPVQVVNGEPEFVIDPWEVCYDRTEPLIGLLTITPSGSFPSYTDLLQVIFYLTTCPTGPLADFDAPPSGLQRGLGPGISWDEGHGRYLTARYPEYETEVE